MLLAVDDDPAALGDVERELRDRYERSYCVVCVDSPDEALEVLEQLSQADEQVALVLAAQWLAGTTGGELLGRVRQLHPHAKRGLLVPRGAWTDQHTAQAIFDSKALGRIDDFVLKPAASPDELFHQAVSSFLFEWSVDLRTAPHTVHIVGEAWLGRAQQLREVFQRCAVPHAFCLADSEEGRGLVAKAGPEARLPLMVLPAGEILSDPSNAEIAKAAGAPRRAGRGGL